MHRVWRTVSLRKAKCQQILQRVCGKERTGTSSEKECESKQTTEMNFKFLIYERVLYISLSIINYKGDLL